MLRVYASIINTPPIYLHRSCLSSKPPINEKPALVGASFSNKHRPRFVKQIAKKLPLGKRRVSQSFACYSCCNCVVTAHTEIPCSKLNSRLSFHALFTEGMFDKRHFGYEVSTIAQLLRCASSGQNDMGIGWFLCQSC